MKWKMKATKMKELPDNMNLKHILSLVIKINALSNTAYQTSRGDRRVFPTWNVQQRSGKMAYIHVHRVGMVDGQKRRYSQSWESAAHGHSPVITPWLLQLPGVSQYLGSPVFSELKKKYIPEQTKRTAPLPWAVLARDCLPAVLLHVCPCSTCSLGHSQILARPWRTVLMFIDAEWIQFPIQAICP